LLDEKEERREKKEEQEENMGRRQNIFNRISR